MQMVVPVQQVAVMVLYILPMVVPQLLTLDLAVVAVGVTQATLPSVVLVDQAS